MYVFGRSSLPTAPSDSFTERSTVIRLVCIACLWCVCVFISAYVSFYLCFIFSPLIHFQEHARACLSRQRHQHGVAAFNLIGRTEPSVIRCVGAAVLVARVASAATFATVRSTWQHWYVKSSI